MNILVTGGAGYIGSHICVELIEAGHDVVDLAKGHVLAIEKYQGAGVHICNLGTGRGYSVLEIVQAFEKVNNVEVKYEIKERRAGDIATCYADPTRAKEQLGWVAEKTLEDMCRDTWNFAKKYK